MKTIKNRKKNISSLKKAKNFFREMDKAYKEIHKSQYNKERLKLASEIAAGVADRLRNPLNIISLSVQHLNSQFIEQDERKEFTEKVMGKIEDLNNMIIDLLNFARPYEPDLEKHHIHEILDRACNLVKYKCIVQRIKVVKNYYSKIPPVNIDPELMEQAFLNIIDNALWAMQKEGKLYIITRFLHNQNLVQVKIMDTGKGISKYDLPRIFDPLFSRKKNGTGLGLSIVYRIIEEHKGSIQIESSQEEGTSFSIKIPVS
ncbi:MAG TPA: ATP-binding protein [Acidobacteriota bacterium]|nr:ATP-binding protein [Acidobacteriota bacterium]